jgi:hypothetical protein
MTTSHFTLRAALAVAALALSFTVVESINAAENPKSSTPAATAPQERKLQDPVNKDQRNCKKTYQLVHRGHPAKGTDKFKLVRVECPTPRA